MLNRDGARGNILGGTLAWGVSDRRLEREDEREAMGRRGSGSGCGDGVGPGESDVEERWVWCHRTVRAGCVLHAIRTESGDMRCDGQEDRRGHDAWRLE